MRWLEILKLSHSPRLTYLSARYHASDPVLNVLRSGAQLRVQGALLHFRAEHATFVLGVEILPAIDLFHEMLQANYGFHLTAENGTIEVPDGPTFLVENSSLVSDLAVVGLRFLKQEYGFFDVAGCTVLDVGANIGDSALYFLERGAAHVSAYEPFSANFSRAQANIVLNGASDRVTLHQCGVAGRADRRSARYEGKIAAGLSTIAAAGSPDGQGASESVTLVPFSQAVYRALDESPGRLVCKMDCEGSEFEIFEEDPDIAGALARIDRLLIEYHWKQPDSIVRCLRGADFEVECLPLQPGVGLILAVRQSNATSNG